MLQSIFNSRLSIHLIIRHSIYPVGIITRYKLCATTDSQKVELTMKTPLITREGYEKLKQEMDYLWRQERPEVTKKVTWAASLGDRSENAAAFAQKFAQLTQDLNNIPGLQQEVMRIMQLDEKKRKKALDKLPDNVKRTVKEMFDLLNN